MEKCIVCKKDIIDVSQAIKTDKGFVHIGVCADHIAKIAISESDQENFLQETELLL